MTTMNEQTMLLETAENRLRRLSLARLRVAADYSCPATIHNESARCQSPKR